MTDSLKIKCPNCGKANTWRSENTFKPFCSHRCKLIDLGEWANESRRIKGESVDPHQFIHGLDEPHDDLSDS